MDLTCNGLRFYLRFKSVRKFKLCVSALVKRYPSYHMVLAIYYSHVLPNQYTARYKVCWARRVLRGSIP